MPGNPRNEVERSRMEECGEVLKQIDLEATSERKADEGQRREEGRGPYFQELASSKSLRKPEGRQDSQCRSLSCKEQRILLPGQRPGRDNGPAVGMQLGAGFG